MKTTEYLQSAYLFHDIEPGEIEQIATFAQERIVEQGDYVYKQGEKGTAFYVIFEGKVELVVCRQGNFSSVTGQIGPGGHFGEGALLTGKPRSLSVRALSRVYLLMFDSTVFHSLLLKNTRFHLSLDKALAERLSLASQVRYDAGLSPDALSGRNGDEVDDSLLLSREGLSESCHGSTVFDHRLPVHVHLTRKISSKIEQFSLIRDPVLITGESGTGRRLAAKQIHLNSSQKREPYIELDLRQLDPLALEGTIFGYEHGAFPFSEGRQLGIFQQFHSGTVVLHHVEIMGHDLQSKLFSALTNASFSPAGSNAEMPLRARVILIAECDCNNLQDGHILIPELLAFFEKQIFTMYSINAFVLLVSFFNSKHCWMFMIYIFNIVFKQSVMPKSKIEIYNSEGKLIATYEFEKNNHLTIKLPSNKKGLYFVTLKTYNSVVSTEKFIVR